MKVGKKFKGRKWGTDTRTRKSSSSLSFFNHGEPTKMVWAYNGLNAVKDEICTAH